jgi:lysophospholipase L1-like esterase
MMPFIRLCLTLAAATVCAGAVAASAGAQSPLDPTVPPVGSDQEASQAAPPRAVANVSLAKRAAGWADAWDRNAHRYANDYVSPTRWTVRLNACSSVGSANDSGARRAIQSWTWRLTPLGGQTVAPVNLSAGGCAVDAVVGAVGRWRVELSVRDEVGSTAGTSREVTLRDLLVVALGDSYASGEGNPNPVDDEPDWIDPQCHRSDAAWPAQAARRLEGGTTAVTFISFACTGAKTKHVWRDNYGGTGGPEQPAQVVAARRALGDPLDPRTRQVDALLVGVGVNNLGFSSVLHDCAVTIVGSCATSLAPKLATLNEAYDDIEVGVSANMRVARTYAAQYPARLFTNGSDNHEACGIFFNMSEDDAEWVTDQGNLLNGKIAAAAQRHGWTAVPTTDAFRRRGYCASDSWFRAWHTSLAQQEDEDGTAHPTGPGHRAVADLIRDAYRPDAVPPAKDRVSVRVLRVKVTDQGFEPTTGAPAGLWDREATVDVDWTANACGRARTTLTGLRLNAWNDVSDNPCLRYTVDTVGRALKLRVATQLGEFQYQDGEIPPGTDPKDLPRGRGLTVRPLHRRATGFDAVSLPAPVGGGVLRATHSHNLGTLEVEYLIVRPPVEAQL